MFILLENLGIYYYFIVQIFNSKVIDHLLNSLHMIEVFYFYVTSTLIFPNFTFLKKHIWTEFSKINISIWETGESGDIHMWWNKS